MNAHAPPPGNIAALPAALAPLVAARRWLVWRWETNERGKRTKVPYRAANPAAKASSTNTGTWGDYTTARDAVIAGRADGIGYCLHGGDVGAFDLDDALGEDGQPLTWAWNLVDEADSYVERTVGGKGLRILGKTAGEKIHRKQKVPGTPSSLETYRVAERFIVVTGAALDGFGGELRDIDRAMDGWVAKLDAADKAERERKRAEKAQAKADTAAQARAERFNAGAARVYVSSELPRDLEDLVRYGVPEGQRSEKFHHAVGWLKDRGLSPAEIEGLLSSYPDGIAAKFIDRLRPEIERSFDKADDRSNRAAGGSCAGYDDFEPSAAGQAEQPRHDPFRLIWHGDEDDTPLTEWLVDETLFKVGTALLSGQWGTYKTFCGFDLSAAVMVGGTFAGRQVKRQGGVLWIAVEGQSEVRKRLAAVAMEKVRPAINGEAAQLDPDRLPFAWVKACPPLSDPDALAKLKALVGTAAAEMKTRFGLDLALVIIDTLSPAAELKDANDTAQNQHVMTVLKKTAFAFDTLVCAVDHMGKDTSTGTRNSSVKEADVDSVMALLGDRDLAGNVANPRLAMRKNRAAPTGWEVKFDKRVVTVGSGFDATTTLVIDWASSAEAEPIKPAKAAKSPWSTAAERTLKGCLERALIDHGSEQQPFGRKGPTVKAVNLSKVRDAFAFTYAVDVDDRAKALDAKRNAFKRARESAIRKGLIATAEIGASLTDWIWFVTENFAEADALDE